MTDNEKELFIKIVSRLGKKINNENDYKLTQILNVNLELNPSSPYINLANIRQSKYDYMYNELQWYMSQDCNINGHSGIENNPIWKQISTDKGFINSNYGNLVFSKENYCQYDKALSQIVKNKFTKHAVIVYIRPSIVNEWNDNIHAKSDFICTYATSFMVDDETDELNMFVNMRSNDFFTGFFNDFGWQVFIYKKFLADVNKYHNISLGKIYWHIDNCHVYKRDYDVMKQLYDYYKRFI